MRREHRQRVGDLEVEDPVFCGAQEVQRLGRQPLPAELQKIANPGLIVKLVTLQLRPKQHPELREDVVGDGGQFAAHERADSRRAIDLHQGDEWHGNSGRPLS